MAVTGKEKLYVSSGGTFRSLTVQAVADYAAAEAGDVVSVNGVTPNGAGEVTLTPASIGAFAANDVSTIGNNLISAPDQATALTAIGALPAGGTAAQATKLATPRAITLTGNATGTANFDGSAAVNIAVTIPAGTVLAPGILQVGDGLGMQSPGIVALAAPGGSKLGGIYQPLAATGLDVTDGLLTSPGLVKSVTTPNVAYINDGLGVPAPIAIAATASTANTMVQRDSSGCITLSPPIAELHGTNKGYVDARTLTQAAVTAIGALTPISTANATDPASTMALVNECKASINSIIAALKAS